MKLKSIEISGFRGFYETQNIEFGENFSIVTGRNGSGKSSICDAIEFALTGDIQRFRDISQKTRKDEADSYLWWKGTWEPKVREVNLTLSDGNNTIEVRRDHRGDLKNLDENELYNQLVQHKGPNERARSLHQILKSSFIRDEAISELSLDLGDRDRFNFVSEIMGLYDLSPYVGTLEKAHKSIREHLAEEQAKLEDANTQLFNLRASPGPRKEQIPDAIKNAVEIIANLIDKNSANPAEVVLSAMQFVTRLQILENTCSAFRKRHEELSKKAGQEEESLRELDEIQPKLDQAASRLEAISQEFLSDDSAEDEVARYVELANAGRTIGLTENDECPLCGQHNTKEEFESHINRLVERGDHLLMLLEERSTLSGEVSRLRRRESELRAIIESFNHQQNEFNQDWSTVEDSFEFDLPFINLRLPPRSNALNLDSLLERIGAAESVITATRVSLEKQLTETQDYNFSEPKTDQDQVINRISEERDRIERSVSELERLENEFLESRRAAQRLAGRFLDDRLIDLDPLLSELYSRLRPHSLWSQIRANIRGDVRHSLSLTVESEDRAINPGFVFSSGQRRAAGLAFLIALAKSNPWTLLDTVIFDDPVQHVDDFRALHLVESMSAMSRTSTQIICTVEDPALASLMSRRMASEPSFDGRVIEMRLGTDGARVAKSRPVLVPETSVLSASDQG